MPDPVPQQTASTSAPPPPDLSGVRTKESTWQTIKRNLTPELDTSRSALGVGHEFDSGPSPQQQGEQQYRETFGSPLERAYGHLKNILAEHEQHLSEKYLAPIREHLDRMGDDLQEAAASGRTKTGGQLTTATRLLAGGTGTLLRMVPVGSNVKETIQMAVTPPELGPEGKALSKELKAGEKIAETAAPRLQGVRSRVPQKSTAETAAPNLVGVRTRPDLGIPPERVAAPNQFNEFRVSTRVPEGRAATEHPLKGEPLTVGLDTVSKAPDKLQDRFVDSISGIAGFKAPKNIAREKVFQRFVRHAADNLKWLHDQVPEQDRIANGKWYESANKVANDLAAKHELTPQQTSGVIASLSPQMDWDMNVSLAKRLVDIYKNHADDVVTPEMITKGREIIKASRKTPETKNANQNLEKILGSIKGRKIGELKGLQRAAAIRLYDEVHNARSFPKIDPATGNELELRKNADGSTSDVAWGNLKNADKALAILDDGSRANISDKVGDSHKVRSFYNNILDPSHPKDITVDTHAVGAALLHPLGGNAPEVLDNFGRAGKNKGTGIVGTYPLYAEAYRLAAQERGLLPRELQSITWEQVRKMFPSEWKTKENLARVKSEWKRYEAGKQSAAQTRKKIAELASRK